MSFLPSYYRYPLLALLFLAAPLLYGQTNVVLTASPNPSRFGAPVALTTTVTPATSSGHVTFYDGINVLGIAPVVGGSATISTIALPATNTLLAGGSRKLRALFVPNTGGTVFSNQIAQTVIAQPASRFAGASSYPVSPSTTVVVGDFNGDGIADVAVGEANIAAQVLLGNGDGTFRLTFTYTGIFHNSPTLLAVGDFNADGKPDLVVMDSNNGLLSILLGLGDGTFQPPAATYSVPTNAAGHAGLALADFNSDGRLDIVVADQGLGILIGNGDGTLQPSVSFTGGPTPTFVVAGDFNGDGRADIATASLSSSVVSVLTGNGNGTFSAPTSYPIPSPAAWLAVGDFNQDGYSDLVTVNPSPGQSVSNNFFNNVSVLLSNGNSGGLFPAVTYPAGLNPQSVAIGDFNGDGVSDLLIGNLGSSNISVLLGRTDGTFQPQIAFPAGAQPYSVTVGDFNGDGKVDLAYVGASPSSAFALDILVGTNLNLTASAGSVQSTVVGTPFPTPLQVTVTNSGAPMSGVTVNFAVPSSGASATLSSTSAVTDANGTATVTATANGTGGSFTVTASALGLGTSFSLVNLVAAPSVLTPSPTTPQVATIGSAFPQPLKVTLTDSAGNPASGVTVTFTAPIGGATATLSAPGVVTNSSGVASVTATANNTVGSYTVTASALGLTANFQLSNVNPVSISLSTATNSTTFGSPVILTAAVTPATATGKITFYDGVTILGTKPLSSGSASLATVLLPAGVRKLTAYYSGDSTFMGARSGTYVQTVRSLPAAGFGPGTPISLGSAVPASVAVGDFNGDGKVDLALPGGQSGPAIVTVMLGQGDGTFLPPVNYPVGLAPTAVAVGDFNGDGLADLAVTNFSAGNVSILLGNGDGTFQAAVNYPSGGSPTSILIADFNGDGKADLVVGGSGTNLLLGNGDGTFAAPVNLPNLANPSSLVAGDFNGDGKADLAVWAPAGSSLVVLLGNGDGTFQIAPLSLTLAKNLSASIATADYNNDGKADISVASPAGNYVLLGNGDGSFQPVISLVSLGSVVGDFNGDGLPDLAGVNGNLFINSDNGDGTFQPPVTFTPPALPLGLAVADFNGDGIADIVTANSAGVGLGSVTVFLGATGGLKFTASAGATQSTLAGTPFPVPLTVSLVNNGTPVANAVIAFGAPPQGASAALSSNTATTNASGIASVTATANSTAGSYVVTANYQSLSVSFNLTNTGVASLTATGGTPQATLVGTPFPAALQVTVKDSAGNPVTGANITFAAPTVGASAALSAGSAVTNASGVASVTATANGTPGAYTVTATLGALTANFSLTNTSAPAASIAATGGTPQVALLGAAFPNSLQATVKDAGGNPVVGATVTFTAPANGPGAVLASSTALTNASGVASVAATANNLPGSYVVTATVGALSTTFSLTNLLPGSSNLALGRTATQSSTFPGSAGASLAVDGNTDGVYGDGSVTATNQDANAWWQVDLGSSATISAITVWNRTDCCASRLSDFWVFASNNPFLPTDTPATLQNRAGTFASHQTTAPNPSTTIALNGFQARYVRVQLSGTDYLSLAEVQVMGTGGAPPPTNLAAGKSASQSSTLPSTPSASVAVDGKTDGVFADGSVTATNQDPNAWWQVDLGLSSTISSVVVWNRTDCCSSRLSDFWVFISNTPFLPGDTPATLQNRAGTFASHITSAPNPSTSINVGAAGRYVRVQLSGTDYLSLAEVQVFGNAPPATNLSQGKFASQSSNYPSSPSAGVAVDGNLDGNYADGSVTATNSDVNAWWQVDLGTSAAISSISIYNRTDCCGSRLSDYWIFISDTPFQPTDTPTTLQNRPGTFSSHQTTAPNPSVTLPLTAQGRYVRIQLTGTNVLSLAEVQVFGVGGIVNPTNVAFNKISSQSSTYPGAPGASAAVDGNTDGIFADGSVTATNLDPNPWWQVDLGVSTAVNTITIWNRTDCCGSRLSDYWVFVSDTPFAASDTPSTLQNRPATFASHQTATPSPSTTIPIAAQGRYVRVQLSSSNYLSLAEVQVFGQ